MSINATQRRLLTLDEVAERLRVTRRTVERKIRAGELPALQLGGPRTAIRVDADELEEWLPTDVSTWSLLLLAPPQRSRRPGRRISSPARLASPANGCIARSAGSDTDAARTTEPRRRRMSKVFTEQRRSGASRPELNKAQWQRTRAAVRRRDGDRCRNCGATHTEARLSVHHLLPASLGGTDDMANLLTLCQRCHPVYEKAANTLTLPLETPPPPKRTPQAGDAPHGAPFSGPDGRPWSRHWFDY